MIGRWAYKMKPFKVDAGFDLFMGKLSLDDSSDNEFRALMGKLKKFWTNHWRNREQVKTEQHRLMWARASPALMELLTVGRETDGEKLFNKLVAFCILMSGLGSPRSEAVVKETYPALQSVVKKTDAAKLADLSRSEREQHLLELVQIVMGIRLFNKDCCKGGEGIDDLPELLIRAVQAAKTQHQTASESIQKHLDHLSSVVVIFYKLDSHDSVSAPNLPAVCSASDLERLKSALCLFWAQRFYFKDLSIELTASEQNISTCVDQLRETLVQLHETVRYRAAIPTIQVYPLFVQLSLVWRELQYEAAVLSHLSQILKAVGSIADDLQVPFECMAGKSSVTASSTPSEAFKFNGFCPWTLVQTGGILFPGSYNEEDLMFRSPEAANAWSQDLTASYSQMQTILYALPELQHFVKIDSEITVESEETAETPLMTADAGVQTEIHPIESHIDRNYTWSEWELKQRHVKLAKLVVKSTKSQQTIFSNFRKNKKI